MQLQVGEILGDIQVMGKNDHPSRMYRAGISFHTTEISKGGRFRIAPAQDYQLHGLWHWNN